MWIHFTVEMDVEAESEDQLYLKAIEKMDDLQPEELTAALEQARCYGKRKPLKGQYNRLVDDVWVWS